MPTHACVGCSLQEQRNISSSFCGIKKTMPGIFCVSKPHCIVSGGSQTIRFARDSEYVYPTACEIELECRIKKVLRRFVVAPLLCWQYSTVLRTCQGKNEKFINLKIKEQVRFLDTLSVMLELFQTGTEREKMEYDRADEQ